MPRSRDDEIRDRAYRLWQDEGEPHGRDQQHWDHAAREIDDEAGTPDAATPDAAAPDAVIAADPIAPPLSPPGTVKRASAKAKPGKVGTKKAAPAGTTPVKPRRKSAD